LEYKGKNYSQSMAICLFLGKKFNLIGENEEQEYFFDTIIDKMGDYISSKNELAGILGGRDVFNYPKPEKMIKEIIRATCDKDKNKKDSIILDFFAGSGTTGEAVMRFNAEHAAKSEESLGGGRRGHVLFSCSCLNLVLKKVRRIKPAIEQLPIFVRNASAEQDVKFKKKTPINPSTSAFACSNSIAPTSNLGTQLLKPSKKTLSPLSIISNTTAPPMTSFLNSSQNMAWI
ncbi:MAG: hypothetical protein J6P00_03005, partial [Acetobacter sp.]|nr:hypothetical protein [Acetobacter sp.]